LNKDTYGPIDETPEIVLEEQGESNDSDKIPDIDCEIIVQGLL
jgi:hypothetical protein